MFKGQQMFSPDPARFVQKERQLRNFHIRNWLQMNRSSKELLELSLNHFYGEHPKLLRWSLDIIDGDPKGLIVAAIVRESNANAAQADIIFEQIQSRIAHCKRLVDEVSRNSNLSTAESRQILQDRVARAGIMPLGYSTAVSNILIVNRPTIISMCGVLLFLSAALTTIFVIGDFHGVEKFQSMGRAGLYISITFAAICGWGYWNMRKWAVLVYAIEPVARLLLGMPHVLIAIPLLIACFGFMHFREMTWK